MEEIFMIFKDGEKSIVCGNREEVVKDFYYHGKVCEKNLLYTTKIVDGKIVDDELIAIIDNR